MMWCTIQRIRCVCAASYVCNTVYYFTEVCCFKLNHKQYSSCNRCNMSILFTRSTSFQLWTIKTHKHRNDKKPRTQRRHLCMFRVMLHYLNITGLYLIQVGNTIFTHTLLFCFFCSMLPTYSVVYGKVHHSQWFTRLTIL